VRAFAFGLPPAEANQHMFEFHSGG
jgi:hypothetical protein